MSRRILHLSEYRTNKRHFASRENNINSIIIIKQKYYKHYDGYDNIMTILAILNLMTISLRKSE